MNDQEFVPVRGFCMHCGAQIPLWFDPAEGLYEVEKDEQRWQQWLLTPCEFCGKAPRAMLQKQEED